MNYDKIKRTGILFLLGIGAITSSVSYTHLSEDSQVLEEVVVVGYGFMKRKDITTAVSVVSLSLIHI